MDDLERFIEEEEERIRKIIEKNREHRRDDNDQKVNAEETERNKQESPYGPYIKVKEHLDQKYFPKDVLGFAQPQTGEAFVNPDVYGTFRGVVKLHERLHIMYNHISEAGIRSITNYLSITPGYVR